MRNQEQFRPITSHLHHGVRQKLDISWIEYILLDTVYHLSAKDGYCYASSTHLAEILGITFNGYKQLRNRLLDRELLVEHHKGLQTSQAFNEIAYVEKYDKVIETAQSSKTAQSSLNRGGVVNKVHKSEQSSDNNYSYTKKINKKDLVTTFDKINKTLQTQSRYSESYGKLLTKALIDFTADELIQAAEHFKWKFHGGSDWHTANQKFYTLKQFLSGDKDRMPRYQTCYEESQGRTKKVSYAGPNPNRNPLLDQLFPGAT